MSKDATAIEQLSAAGADLTVPHTVLHYIYMPVRKSAALVARELRQRGFQTEERLGADNVNWLVLATHQTVVSEDFTAPWRPCPAGCASTSILCIRGRHERAPLSTQALVVAMIAFLLKHSDSDINSFAQLAVTALASPAKHTDIKEDVVARHLLLLENALGNDAAFTAAYNTLEQHGDVGKLEIAAIAKRFTDTNPKSRPAALKKIWARHHSLVTFDAKSRSRDGRSAA
jgi:hypothetical protein